MIYSYTIKGRPITKKNSQQRTSHGLIQSKQYRLYEKSAIWQLKAQDMPPEPITRPVILKVKYYMPNRQGWPDLLGLLQATADILEKAGILADDRLIYHIDDGSAIWGIDKDKPRAEIKISEITDFRHPAYHLDPWIAKKLENNEYEDVHTLTEEDYYDEY